MQPMNCGTLDAMANDRDFAEKRFNRPGEYRAAVVYALAVVAVAGIAFALYATGPRDSIFSAALVPVFLFAGGVGALVIAYRKWKAEAGWTAWQGAGWFLLLLMLVTLSVPGSAAFAR
jgi:peptidoglycan/LPS O-acetylase OafA/YrhL